MAFLGTVGVTCHDCELGLDSIRDDAKCVHEQQTQMDVL